MQLTAEHRQQPEHRMSLSALAVQSLAMIARTQSEIDAEVAATAARNPVLVRGSPRRCRWCGGRLVGGSCGRCTGHRLLTQDPAARVSDRQRVRDAARQLVSGPAADMVDLVLDALDDRGLLPQWPFDGGRPDDLDRAVSAVITAGPPGTAAPDALTCLIRQAENHAANGGPVLLPDLLRRCPELFAAADPVAAGAGLGLDRDAVRQAVDFARRRLTPAPLPRTADNAEPPSPPDIILTAAADGTVVATVLTAADLGLQLDRGGIETDGAGTEAAVTRAAAVEAAAWWRPHLIEAATLLDLLDRRAGALRRIGTALAVLQREFVLHGPASHVPLTRCDLAHRLGLHPSTVTRAVAGATVALPSGRVIPAAAFFGGAVAAKTALFALLDGPVPPRSDADAVAALAAAGHWVARRTVAKYRAERTVGAVARRS